MSGPEDTRAHIFPTAIGSCGLTFGAHGINGLWLPADNRAQLEHRLRRERGARIVDEPPPAITRVTERLQQHLDGAHDPDPLSDVPLDLRAATPFGRHVYLQARRVGPGRTISYAALAHRSGRPGGARAVGQAMARNPIPLLVPCHRVLGADGGLGGFSAPGGITTKLRLLTLEGADLHQVARAGTRTIARSDDRLATVIHRVGRFRLTGPNSDRHVDHFTSLAKAIVHQQVSVKAGASIFGRLRQTQEGGPSLDPRRLLQTPSETLRAAGLSRQKVSYLQDLASQILGGALPLDRLARMDDERVIQHLTQVKGIGRWSAEMHLIFRLGRLDVLPLGDLGLRRGAQLLYGLRRLPSDSTLQRLARRWVPFRSIGTWYVWRHLDAGGL